MRYSHKHAHLFVSHFFRIFVVGLAGLCGCGPRFSCPVRPPPEKGAYTRVSDADGHGGLHGQLYQEPSDAQVAVDPACSTVCVDGYDPGGLSPISGTVDLTIDPTCTGDRCLLTFAGMHLETGDFSVGGRTIVSINAGGYRWAEWDSDTTFAIHPFNFGATALYGMNGMLTGYGLSWSNESIMWGTIDRNYDNFSLAGNASTGFHLSLCGRSIAHPPNAVLIPAGPFQADHQGLAHVTVSAEQSYDPDGDIINYIWTVDGFSENINSNILTKDLPLGIHSIGISVVDSRGAHRTVSEIVEVLN